MKKTLLSLFLLSIGFFLIKLISPTPAHALAKFATTYQITYEVKPDGNTHVTFLINQKNNLSVVYATDFSLSVNQTRISNVKIMDESIPLVPEINRTSNQTTISFAFENKIVGKDKNHQFTIEYDTSDITTKFGNTWQINIPRLETNENLTAQTVILITPEQFPAPAYIDPKPDIVKDNSYFFNDKSSFNKSISAVFGETQFYSTQIIYHLQNTLGSKESSEIALIPDTPYQTVYIKSLDPMPTSISKDKDGNWLAKYILDGKTKQDIKLEAIVKLNFIPKQVILENPNEYLLPNSLWDHDNSQFSTIELKNLNTAKQIYDFTSDKLSYDYRRITQQKSSRVPASESLKNPNSAICTDFTNVFISLARKAGIQARELQGYALSENSDLKPISLSRDVLHAWPEYYDKIKSTWVQIDPTWSNTTHGVDYFNKLDFNHIVFVIHGMDPLSPISAGGYKNGENTKDVSVEPIEAVDFPTPTFELQHGGQEGDSLILNVLNTSGVSFEGSVTTQSDEYISKIEQKISIAPFSKQGIGIKLKKTPMLSSISREAIIYVNGQRIVGRITIWPVFPKTIVFSVIGVILGLGAIIARSLHLRRRKKRASIYR